MVIGAVLYCLFYAAAAAAGLPIGWRLFGRGNPAGWVAGALIGYALTSIALWVPIAAGVPSGPAFAASWAVVCAAAWFGVRERTVPLFAVPAWERGDTVAYVLVMLLTGAIAVPPFAKLGSEDDAGNKYYRAYFTADFVWHTALASEVGKFSMPPRNPFLRNRPIHYYWGYFLVPASISSAGPGPVRDVERSLKLNAVLSGLLFISAIFMSVRAAVPSPAAAGVSVALALLASSAEGVARLWQLWSEGSPLSAVREANIDAITAWVWGGYRVDGLQRALWYNPHHSMAGSLGLIGLAAAAAGSPSSLAAGLLIGIPLAGSVAMNPFIGGIFSLAFGAGALVHALRSEAPVQRIVYSAAAAAPVALALAWCVGNQMVEGAGGALEFGFSGISTHSPLVTLMLSLGPALAPALAGLLVRGGPFGPLIPSATLAGVALFLMYFVRLSVDEYWVGFRTGHMLLVSLPALTARFFRWAFAASVPVAAGMIAVVLLSGAPTTLIDAYNAQDLTNREMAPGAFRWTTILTAAEVEALRWVRDHTPKAAVVQQDSASRLGSTWWVVPTFAQRRMAAGLPPFMLDIPEYHEKSARVRDMFATGSAAEAAAIARSLRIDYIYINDFDRGAYPGGIDKFEDRAYFTPAFKNDAAAVYQVK
jgi:hypothetical protein